MTIQHLVMSGGGPSGIAMCGTINSLLDFNYMNIKDLKSIHATSVGTLISLFLCFNKLGIDFDSIRDYIVHRPFHETYKINVHNILNLYHKKGFYDENVSLIFFKPFFELLELSKTITMLELYELTGIELYFYAFNVNQVKLVPFSFKETPDLPVIYAIYMSSTVPIIFSPYVYINQCYIDGGFLCNYPLNQCIEMNRENHDNDNDTILGIYNKYDSTKNGYIQYNQDCNIIEFIAVICYNLITYINSILFPQSHSKNNIVELPILLNMSFTCIKKLLFHNEERLLLYETGYSQGKKHAQL